jgi:hypothetical protein
VNHALEELEAQWLAWSEELEKIEQEKTPQNESVAGSLNVS